MFQVSVNMTEYKCYSCDAESPDPAVILAHTIIHHPDKPLSIRVKCVHHSRVAFRSLHYRHIPRKIEERHQPIWISPNSLKVWIADHEDADQVFDKEEVMSPTPKRLRKVQDDIIHDGKVTKNLDLTGDDVEHDENLEDISPLTSDASCQVSPQGLSMDLEETYAQFVELLPAVLKNLKQAGKLDGYTKFMEMIAYDRFPMDNIAHLLFLDVIEWFSLENGAAMRYNDKVKMFWRLGWRLFRG